MDTIYYMGFNQRERPQPINQSYTTVCWYKSNSLYLIFTKSETFTGVAVNQVFYVSEYFPYGVVIDYLRLRKGIPHCVTVCNLYKVSNIKYKLFSSNSLSVFYSV